MASDSVATGAIVGQSGVERTYNKMLMGEDGARRVVVNSVGREIRTLEELPPVEGRRVQLAINYAMQQAAEEAFRALRLLGIGGRARAEDRRRAHAREPAGVRPERVSPPASTARPGRR